SDWLQGPYQYKLYQSYGFDIVDIAFLFLTGFISGAVGGTLLGSTADTWQVREQRRRGRRRVCLIFCATSFVACLLRLVSNYFLLLVSHMLSGIASATLFSVFEAWYVSEHMSTHIPAEWMSRTFARATFLNGLVAIVAGLVANGVVSLWGFKAPYAVAMGLLMCAGSMIGSTWAENYGELHATGHHPPHLAYMRKTALDTNILVLCVAQTMFECSMYIFVLLYTPAIESGLAIYKLPFGYLFSTMMVMVMLGSYIFQKLSSAGFAWLDTGRILVFALLLSSISFFMMVYKASTSIYMLLLGFHLFEFSTGLYYPSLSSLKAKIIPEETRAAIMTILRIPMNVGVGVIMWHVSLASMIG
ncbi:molybdate-anion transporter MOT2, partial [Dichotomocladium elegans]